MWDWLSDWFADMVVESIGLVIDAANWFAGILLGGLMLLVPGLDFSLPPGWVEFAKTANAWVPFDVAFVLLATRWTLSAAIVGVKLIFKTVRGS